MPTYAYACADCGHRFDIVQAFTDDSLTVCPECSGTLRKQFSAVGVVFKGSGFYRTDSRSSTSATSGATPKSEPSSTGGSEAKTGTSEKSGEKSTSPASSTTSSSSTGTSSSTPVSTASK